MKLQSIVALALAVALSVPSTVVAREVPTDGAVADSLLQQVLEPVLQALAAHPGAAGVALRPPAGAGAAGLHEQIGNFLHDRGYEVWTLPPTAEVPEGALLLDFEVRAAGFDYPRKRDGFLGLGASRSLRRGAIGLSGRLEDPRDGHWLWRGSPLVQSEHWIRTKDRETLSADRPPWMARTPLAPIEQKSGWWERVLVGGLLAGVVLLYADGAQ